MDQQITAVIVNRKENKLKKSCGYHLDLLVVALMLILCSIMGLPWFVAATVLSITHVNSLRMESESAAPGELPKFLGVREQRVTGIMIFVMIGVSVSLTAVLALIPMPVLYGVFLYMGTSSLNGVQFFDRMLLFLMPSKHQPDYSYLRHVPLKKVYLFTFLQLAGLVVLWLIKSTKPVSIIFPGEWDKSIRIEPPQSIPTDQKKRLTEEPFNFCSPNDECVPHGAPGPELKRTGRLFGGLMEDIKRKSPFYWSDFKDAFNVQCLASFIFLYFAVLTPIVTFGGLLNDATHSYLGTMESLLGGCIAGVAFHMFSGQPLTIIGSTGPILVFEKIMFELCGSLGISYIAFRVWVGCWTGFACILLVAFDASSLICYVTRYTEETFSALISLIFIFEAFKKLIGEAAKNKVWAGWRRDKVAFYGCECSPPDLQALPVRDNLTRDMMSEIGLARQNNKTLYGTGEIFKLTNLTYTCVFGDEINADLSTANWNSSMLASECKEINCGVMIGDSCDYAPDVLLMSVLLFFGTYFIAVFLKSLKTSRFFSSKIRSLISDFAVTIAIVVMVAVDLLIGIQTTKLDVPKTFKPTRDDRGWFINPLGENEWWTIPLAIIPAILATILIFMDQQITAVIVNRKENKLKKSCGYHLDLLVVALMLILCSIMGLPWFVAATVLSITHVNSLRMESESAAPGELPKFLGVREQRVTGIMIFVMIGVSVSLTAVLALIPMPVLYGVFLYMGTSSLNGVQFFDRMLLFLMPSKHQPDYSYLRHVPLKKVYLFTFLQLAGLVVLWLIKSTKPVSIIFPMMVAALVGIRKLFDYGLFSQHDLAWLDDIVPEFSRAKKDKKKLVHGSDDEDGEDGHATNRNGKSACVALQIEQDDTKL